MADLKEEFYKVTCDCCDYNHNFWTEYGAKIASDIHEAQYEGHCTYQEKSAV